MKVNHGNKVSGISDTDLIKALISCQFYGVPLANATVCRPFLEICLIWEDLSPRKPSCMCCVNKKKKGQTGITQTVVYRCPCWMLSLQIFSLMRNELKICYFEVYYHKTLLQCVSFLHFLGASLDFWIIPLVVKIS